MADDKTRTLLKILVGAAWIDGEIQREERNYLRNKAQEVGLAEDPELKPLLYELVPVQPQQCYQWVETYLGDRPSSAACQDLIEAISGLIYSDGVVDTEEAKLLTRIQALDPGSHGDDLSPKAILKSIQQLYRHWLDRQ